MSPVGKKANIGIYIVLIVSDRFHKTGFGLPLICKLEVAVRTHYLAKTTHAIYFLRRVHHAFTWVYKRIAALVLFAANGEMRFSLLQPSITHSFHQLFSRNCIDKTVTVLSVQNTKSLRATFAYVSTLFQEFCIFSKGYAVISPIQFYPAASSPSVTKCTYFAYISVMPPSA